MLGSKSISDKRETEKNTNGCHRKGSDLDKHMTSDTISASHRGREITLEEKENAAEVGQDVKRPEKCRLFWLLQEEGGGKRNEDSERTRRTSEKKSSLISLFRSRLH